MKQTIKEKLELRREAHQSLEDARCSMTKAGEEEHNDTCLKMIQLNLQALIKLQTQFEENHATARK